ncbi:tetratricopeptide repeat protein [Microbispora tritici]|uniref:Tetratricopeptide repeat protein n=2 Tax=Microbispora TaxID=2005 RepID=A0ABY3LWC8_9ACTN|nr:tetratricopeptide repeat protein [Microbispora fusca]TYB57711.1 tetratricopeptide repeat protein [Microbispora tritici]
MDNAEEHGTSQGSPYRLQLLGPVAAWREGRTVDLGPPLQRAALCVLAARAGRVVTKDTLIGGLWGDRPPNTAEQSVYTYIAGLRRVLERAPGRRGPYSTLISRSRGYVLERGVVEADVGDFERHLAEARRLQAAEDPRGVLRTLDAASDCWSGPALCGVPGPFAEAERVRLEELRLTALEDRADAMLDLELHQEAVTALTELVAEAPLRERTRDLLMLALYRTGRQADALDTYLDVKRLLAERLGVDPGEALRERYELILRADPSLDPERSETTDAGPGARPPRQLPRAATGFVGRVEELVRLRSLLTPWDGGVPQAVVAITGAPGTGKSALAVQAAHTAAHAFPDGQLYVNLLGATPGVGRLEPIGVLARLLRALGLEGKAVPTEEDEAAAVLRDRLEGRRTLILLDDAAGPEQVRSLLGLPSGNTVLITSRESFAVADDCVRIILRRMRRSEGVTVLSKLVGAERILGDPAAAAHLVELCGGLPLALRLAAARLGERPDWNARDLGVRLEDRRRTLHELESGQIAVRSSLELSYEALARGGALDRLAARTLCHLGVLHVASVTADVVAALVGEPADAAERALDRLVRAHLLETGEAGRYQPHDLVRLFTIELADTHLTPHARKDALMRALGFYGATTRHASTLLDPHRVHLPWPDVPQRPLTLTTPAEARAWLDQELTHVISAASQAMAKDDDESARLGAYVGFALTWQLIREARYKEQLELSRQALSIGKRTGDPDIQALAYGQISTSLASLGRPEEALPYQEAELELRRAQRDRFGEMRALGNLSTAQFDSGRYAEAYRSAEAQNAIAREIGSAVGERHSLLMAGSARRGLGDTAAAMNLLEQALSLARVAGDRHHESSSLLFLAELCLDQGDPSTARDYLERGLRLSRESGQRGREGHLLGRLAQAHRLLGEPEPALRCALKSLAIGQRSGDEQLRRQAEDELREIGEAFPGVEVTPPRSAEEALSR